MTAYKHAAIGAITFVIVCAIAAGVVFLYPRAEAQPAAFLPADNIIALWKGLNEADAATLKLWLPALAQLPTPAPGDTVALVNAPDNSVGWITFKPTLGSGRMPFVVTSSSPQFAALVAETQSAPLHAHPAYLALARQRSSADAWLFYNPTLVTQQSTAFPWLKLQSPIGLTWNAQSMKISLSTSATTPRLPVIRPQMELAGNTRFAMQFATLSRWMPAIQQAIDPTEASILSGVFQATIQRLLGETATLTYDLLPLVERESSVQIVPTLNGSAFVLRGTVRETSALEAHLAALHTSVRNAQSAIRREQRQLDDTFASDILGFDDGAKQTRTRSIEGWEMQVTGSGKLLLATATDGTTFIVSNSIDALEAQLRSPITLPAIESASLVARGTLDPSWLANTFTQTFPTLSLDLPRLPGIPGNQVLWEIRGGPGSINFMATPATR